MSNLRVTQTNTDPPHDTVRWGYKYYLGIFPFWKEQKFILIGIGVHSGSGFAFSSYMALASTTNWRLTQSVWSTSTGSHIVSIMSDQGTGFAGKEMQEWAHDMGSTGHIMYGSTRNCQTDSVMEWPMEGTTEITTKRWYFIRMGYHLLGYWLSTEGNFSFMGYPWGQLVMSTKSGDMVGRAGK